MGRTGRLVWVGRLVAHKRPELLVPLAERGFAIDVIGRGPAESAIRGAHENIVMHGFLAEDAKTAIVAGALLHLSTSQGEGWGLSVLEAAALGVPTVAFDVEGLRDAIRDGRTGWLVKDGEDFADVCERAAKELQDPARAAAVAADCLAWAAELSWPRSTARMLALAAACPRTGSVRGTRQGAWIVEADKATMVAEGPVLDELMNNGGIPVRPATMPERLLGTPAPAP
jgi:glycosyltransferase involved in cell wall biosynthesis